MIKNTSRASLCTYSCIALAAFTVAAHAETNPYYLGASLTRGHDSNIFRLPKDRGPQSDSFTTATLLAGFDQPISRQRLYTNLEVRRQRFDDLSELDNTGHKLTAGLDWETAGNYSGSLTLGSERALASYSTPLLGQSAIRELNLKRERTLNASVQRGTLRNDLQIFGAFNTRDTDYSSDAFKFRDTKRHAVRVGARWHRSDLLTLGTAWVEARGKYSSVGIDYSSHAIEFTGDWKASSASSIDGRIGYEQRSYDNSAPQRDFSGVTGLLRWRWEPTGKLAVTTSLVRDADDSERFIDPGSSDLTVAGSRVTNSVMLEGQWKATAKISVNAGYRYSDRTLVNPTATTFTRQSNDKTRQASLGAVWTATNSVSLGCNLIRETRSTEGELSFPFRANTATCYIQALLK